MPRAEQVRPKRWSQIRILFDNNSYSLISGTYRHDDGTQEDDCIGERWNGQSTVLGFPNVSGHPVWHVVPKFLKEPVLKGLLKELATNPGQQVAERGFTAGARAATERTSRINESLNR